MNSGTIKLKKVVELVGGIMFLGWTFILGIGGFFLLVGVGYSLYAGYDVLRSRPIPYCFLRWRYWGFGCFC